MSHARRADWAANVPWAGILGKPAFVDGPRGAITIADVEGLQAALDSKQSGSGGALARVAYTGNYNDLRNLPALGSAAFANTSDFSTALTEKQLQTGVVILDAGVQSYAVVFSTTMETKPKIYMQVLMADGSGEMFSAVVQEDTLTRTGFSFWLNGIPSTSTGKVRWRATTEVTPNAPSDNVVATGGVVTTVGPYTIHTFLTAADFVVSSGGLIDILMVGGGGGGGGHAGRGGGGGAGGMLVTPGHVITPGTYPVVIGAGGAGGTNASHNHGANGADSTFHALAAIGGGGGGGGPPAGGGRDGSAGGSGGGAGDYAGTGAGGVGTAGQGNDGGIGEENPPSYGGGGGGGAGAIGGNGSSTFGGAGGNGLPNAYSGSVVTYAGGGGSSSDNNAPGAGGTGGGGNGGYYGGGGGPAGTAGAANKGGGGGGSSDNHDGAAGGSGIVIIRYLTP